MREKYIERDFPIWFSVNCNKKDVSYVEGELGECLTAEQAAKVIAKHDEVVYKLIEVVMAWYQLHPHECADYWFDERAGFHKELAEG